MVMFYINVLQKKEVELLLEEKAKLEKKLELLREEKAELEKEHELAQEIYTDREYTEIVEKTGLLGRIKKIILDHGPFTDSEIDVFAEENLNRPVLEEIFNDFKGNEDKKRHEKIWRDRHKSNHAPPDLPGIYRRQ